jgi:hypothetical protein
LQQTIAHLERDKAKQDDELNAAQQAKLAQAKEDLKRVTKELKDYAGGGGDGIDTKLAAAVAQLAERQEALEEENRTLRQQIQRPSTASDPDQVWSKVKAEYPHVDLRVLKSEWTKALQDATHSRAVKQAQKQLDDGSLSQEAFESLVEATAQDIYHPRASTLNESKKPPTATGPAPTPATSRRSVPMNTAGNPQPPQDVDPTFEAYQRLSREMDKKGRLIV